MYFKEYQEHLLPYERSFTSRFYGSLLHAYSVGYKTCLSRAPHSLRPLCIAAKQGGYKQNKIRIGLTRKINKLDMSGFYRVSAYNIYRA